MGDGMKWIDRHIIGLKRIRTVKKWEKFVDKILNKKEKKQGHLT